MVDERMKNTVRHVMTMLVQGDYDGLERLSHGNRLSATEIADAVNDYGEILILPPDSAFENLDIIEIDGAEPKAWDVRVGIWTAPAGISDLTLELTLKESEKELYDVQVDNLHVL